MTPADVIERRRLSIFWLARSAVTLVVFWSAATVLPRALCLSGPWRAFGTGLVVPGAGLLYAIPAMHHDMSVSMIVGHAALIVTEFATAAWILRTHGWPIAVLAVVLTGVVIAGCFRTPYAIVVFGHIVAFLGVLVACGWAIGLRLIARADSVTPVAVVVGAAAAGAALTAAHRQHPGPMAWTPWAALGTALAVMAALTARSAFARRSSRRLARERVAHLDRRRAETSGTRTGVAALDPSSAAAQVTEATIDELRLLRYLVGVATQPADRWEHFDDEASGPLQQYRYQVNALGWALAAFNYSHTPSYTGVLTAAQVALVDRLQRKAVWGYWYWQNLLGNWDFRRRRADPIDVPQNIMFTGYLNLQLAMFRQATGDPRFDRPGALTFDWSPRQKFTYDHQRINAIAIRNFGQDLCLWPCEPILSPGRRRGYVFPYCNAVTTAGIAIMDTVNGSRSAQAIARDVARTLQREFTWAANDLAAFIVSGLGLSVRRVMSGTGSTAGVAAFIAPLCPDLGWRAWEILKREWLETGGFRQPDSAGREMPDWSTGARTNAETLAAAMHLARVVGDRHWHRELWSAATEQLHFTTDREGIGRFAAASVHANGMLGLGAMGRGFGDMLTRRRPSTWQQGPRLIEAPHPEVLVAKAVSDGSGLDLVLYPGGTDRRVGLRLDRLQPGRRYVAHGATEPVLTAGASGLGQLTVDLRGRTSVEVRPA
ncbi:linalool dehydratase/isomerase domain-containing protein [Mycobacterium sp. 050134]|uniref:linalool dehydratase/isomerase domain-containing protein n=1 Tax=Mycobacterium sp. 050134 TaxID=3096111 RepID=UPI002EDB6984